MVKQKLNEEELGQTLRFIILDEMRKLINKIKEAFRVTTKILGTIFRDVSDADLMSIYKTFKLIAQSDRSGRGLLVLEQLSYLHQRVG